MHAYVLRMKSNDIFFKITTFTKFLLRTDILRFFYKVSVSSVKSKTDLYNLKQSLMRLTRTNAKVCTITEKILVNCLEI